MKNKFESLIKKIIKNAPVPLLYKDDFLIYKTFPVKSEDFNLYSDKINDLPKVGIVIQGPIIEKNNFTLETLLNYKKIFNNENIEIILSTWQDKKSNFLNDLPSGVHIIETQKPANEGLYNVNCQIESTQKGAELAQKLGCKYILKTRTDQRFYSANIIEFLLNILKTFPLEKNVENQKERLIALSFNSFKYRIYGISDMFLFGCTEDVLKYWSCKFLDKSKPTKELYPTFNEHFYGSPETYVASEYLKKIGETPDFTLEDSLSVYAKYFCFIDKETVEMFWPKYSNANSRWQSFEYSHMEEIKFVEWLNLYYKKGVQPTYTIENFKAEPLPPLNLDYFLKYPRRALERKDLGEKFTIF